MTMSRNPETWTPDNMYEHVNGEAELLKRYGARNLLYVIYENGADNYITIDLLDMDSAINAYGLYRLYAGCDGEEFSTSGAVVLASDWTYYAQWERYFLRMDVETSDTRQTVTDFLAALFGTHPAPAAPSEILVHLQDAAGQTCSVNYHPEDVDYELGAGPGYVWSGPDGRTYYMRFMETNQKANDTALELSGRGVQGVKVRGNLVAWPKEPSGLANAYLEGVLERMSQ